MDGKHISQMFYITSEINKIAQRRLKVLGLSDFVITHSFILEMLFNNEGKMAMKDLAEGISRTKSTVTQLVEKLMKHGFVTKEQCTLDKRFFYVSLTPKAYSYQEDLQSISKEINSCLYATLNDFTLEKTAETLTMMCDNLNSYKK